MQVNLSWSPVANALFYNIYRGTITGGPYIQIAQTNPNPGQNPGSGQVVTTFQDGPGNLVNGTTYFYRISTVTADGESAYSAEITATAPAQPPAPTGITVVVT